MAQVAVHGVSKSYGKVRAVDEVDLEIADGEFAVLVGPSGCGKTTLLRLMAGLEEVTEGSIVIGGETVTHLPAARRDIGMVFQSYALYPHMKVFDNMAYNLKVKRVPKREIRERVDESARTFGLDELLDRRPAALSGGQRQRVALARALIRRPQLFLLDEPLSNLAAQLRGEMRVATTVATSLNLGAETSFGRFGHGIGMEPGGATIAPPERALEPGRGDRRLPRAKPELRVRLTRRGGRGGGLRRRGRVGFSSVPGRDPHPWVVLPPEALR